MVPLTPLNPNSRFPKSLGNRLYIVRKFNSLPNTFLINNYLELKDILIMICKLTVWVIGWVLTNWIFLGNPETFLMLLLISNHKKIKDILVMI